MPERTVVSALVEVQPASTRRTQGLEDARPVGLLLLVQPRQVGDEELEDVDLELTSWGRRVPGSATHATFKERAGCSETYQRTD